MDMKGFTTPLMVAAIWAGIGREAVAGGGSFQTAVAFTNNIDGIACEATNVSTTPIATVTVALIDGSNVVQNTLTCSNLQPSNTCQAFAIIQVGHCSITFSGSKKAIRGYAVVVDSANNMKGTLPAN
jgi:hypothetical protein